MIRGEFMEVGQVVFSKSGRDKGMAFIVISVSDDYVYIVDGDLRKLEKPKLKKIRHVQKTNTVDEFIKSKIENKQYLLDSDIKKALKKYKPYL